MGGTCISDDMVVKFYLNFPTTTMLVEFGVEELHYIIMCNIVCDVVIIYSLINTAHYTPLHDFSLTTQ